MDRLLPSDLVDAMCVFETPKFMFTKDKNNEPNSALVMSWTVYNKSQLVYGDFMTYKSRLNLLDGNREMSILVLTMDLESWLIKAEFESYHRNDDVFEFMAMTPLFRYSQYTNARAAGLANPVSVSAKHLISKISVLSSFVKAKMAAKKVPHVETREGNMSFPIIKRFRELAAVKILSFIDEDGYPVGFPEFGMLPVHSNRIVMKRTQEQKRGYNISDGQRVAVSLVTLEPAVFQMKGTFRELDENTAMVEVDRVYVCSLPRPGARIDIPLTSSN